MAKGFKDKVAGAQPVYSIIIGSAHDAQYTQEVQEVRKAPTPQAAPDVLGTQGRKGAKLPRINMAFSTQSLDYLRVMAALKGVSITRYVNDLVEQDMARNAEAYDAAKHLTRTI